MSGLIDQRASFGRIRYANCWEDPQLLLDGLNIKPGANCLSIASSGDNTLALLLADPALVVAVDVSIPQLSCLELRIAAIRKLEHANLLAFLGVTTASDRLKTYALLRNELPTYAREYWNENHAALEQGIVHAGKFEDYFKLFRTRVLPLIHRRATREELLAPKTRDQRAAFYDRKWNSLRWRLIFRIFFSRAVLGRAGRDPEFFRYVEGSVADRILSRTKYALTELDPSTNPFVDYIMSGNFRHSLPLYLRPENLEIIRSRLERVKVVHGDTDTALASFVDRFDAYNLSDIFEYMNNELFERTAHRLIESAAPRARFAYWNLLLPRKMSDSFPGSLDHLSSLSSGLHSRDQAFFYSAFHIEEVSG